MALSEVSPGAQAKIIEINGGKEVRRKLLGMGIVPGAKVEILLRRKSGPMLISVMGQQICLGQGIARKVMVA